MSHLARYHPLDLAKVKVGDLLATDHGFKVLAITEDRHSVCVQDRDEGMIVSVPMEFVAACHSADQFDEETEISVTRAQALLAAAGSHVWSVRFFKKSGVGRTIRGRLAPPGPERDALGYTGVVDLDLSPVTVEDHPRLANRFRRVNQREIRWLILDGVKYQVVPR